MDKKDVARVLEQIAACLELKGENTFRVRAYHTAAKAVAGIPGDLREALSSGQLAEVKGIGSATLEIVTDVLRTGRSRVLDDLRTQIPPGLVEMMQISGLGVAKIRQIYESLHVDSIGELEEVARDGRLAKLPRFGKKTAENVLKGITFLRQVSGLRLFHHARDEAAALAEVLRGIQGVTRVEIAGSLRRRREIIRDLDFVVQLDRPAKALFDRLTSAPGVTEFVDRGEWAGMVKFANGIAADIVVAPAQQFGFQLVRATGSEDHLAGLIAHAGQRGLRWTDAGLTRDDKPVAGASEDDVYKALGLPMIPPELREGLGEIAAAAAGRLPSLVERKDLRGFLHCHSDYSDGTSTVREWAEAAVKEGYDYLGITDHSGSAAYAGGLSSDDVGRQHLEIDSTNRAVPAVRMLKGVEADILADGSLDYTADVRASFDFIIASVHSRLGMSEREMTDRVLKAMDDPTMAILGHPTGRLLLSRDPYPMDIDLILEKAAEKGIAVEINADPQRLDLDWRAVRRAAEMGVMVSIGADAHSTAAMGNAEIGVGVARKGWVSSQQLLNARPLDDFLEFVNRRRAVTGKGTPVRVS